MPKRDWKHPDGKYETNPTGIGEFLRSVDGAFRHPFMWESLRTWLLTFMFSYEDQGTGFQIQNANGAYVVAGIRPEFIIQRA